MGVPYMPVLQATDEPSRLGAKIGVNQVRSGRDVASLVEQRLPIACIDVLVSNGLAEAEVYQLIIPRRTLTHRKSKQERLSRDESDKAVRVARVATMAEQVFGDSERSWRWLRKSKQQFDGKTPLEMLASEAGAHLVEELIIQIQDGMFA